MPESKDRCVLFVFVLVLLPSIALIGCGGGSGGSGGAQTGESSHNGAGAISLLSIQFPESTDLTGGGPQFPKSASLAPKSAPLGQQVVFIFSGPIQGPLSAGSIDIHTIPGPDYTGPLAVYDQAKQLIPARGSYEIAGNLLIFTPYIPFEKIDMTTNAVLENIPGLLPGYTYTIFVPVQSAGAIANLAGVDPAVQNPISFSTTDSQSLYYAFRNFPAVPPELVSVTPAPGSEGLGINTFSPVPDMPDFQEIRLEFAAPLDFQEGNLEGIDRNEDGVREQNLFLQYTDASLYAAVDRTETELGFIATLNPETDQLTFVGYSDYEGLNVGLRSLVFSEPFKMLGCSGRALYDVEYEQVSGSVCTLSNRRELTLEAEEVKGLALIGWDECYALDSQGTSLLRIDPESGKVTALGVLPPGLGTFRDLTLGLDDELYGLRVFGEGQAKALGTVERIDRLSLTCEPVLTGLQGDFTSLTFSHGENLVLYEASSRKTVRVRLGSDDTPQAGDPVQSQSLTAGARVSLAPRRYELGGSVVLLENQINGSAVRIEPSGILPTGTWIDIMLRHSLAGLSGGKQANNPGANPLGGRSVCTFRTQVHEGVIHDTFLEDFTDHLGEETHHHFANAAALWNVQDGDSEPPAYDHLLAGIGFSGAGELGSLVPGEAHSTIHLDTNYQPFPMMDGSVVGPATSLVVKGGAFHFHDIIIPEHVTVRARGDNPLVLTATGRVEIAGTIDVSGLRGSSDVTFNSGFVPTPGGHGGPGGGRGGMGQPPIPEDFSSLTLLQSVPRGERGFGPGNLRRIGGQGGESGAKGFDVAWTASWVGMEPIGIDPDSRGAGGGGGSYLLPGHEGYPGLGQYGVDKEGTWVRRPIWDYWDGSYAFVSPDWDESMGYPDKINEFGFDEDHRAPHGGVPGEAVFADDENDNNFLGAMGELQMLQGGQGGGGGGSRLDSMNPATTPAANAWNPPVAPSAYDAKGGGGGGGGGALAIHCLGPIKISRTGRLYAQGGKGGGGEVVGYSNFGGSGGGGSGGAIVLNSAESVLIEGTEPDDHGILDVSGGFGGDAKETTFVIRTPVEFKDTCRINLNSGVLIHGADGFCSWSRGDGGAGGYGMIQLMVPNPETDLVMPGWPLTQEEWQDDDLRAGLLAVKATLSVIETEPNYEKRANGQELYSLYNYDLSAGPPYQRIYPDTADCLVSPYRSLSSISAKTYAVSRWIDMGGATMRAKINGHATPYFADDDGFHGFRGLVAGEENWALVHTANGHVVDAHVPDFNDIEVDSPDKGVDDYIDPSNQVAIQFQGTDALLPGSKVPDERSEVVNETTWTKQLSSLEGKQFIRFRVRLDTAANGTPMAVDNYKPQVNKVRLRFSY